MASLVAPSAVVPGVSAPATSNGQHDHRPEPSSSLCSSAADIQLNTVEEAIQAIANGEFVVVMDDLSRENEGDLITSGALVTTERMAWMIRHTSGFICIAMTRQRLDELEIPMMVLKNTDKHRTAYTVTVDHREGTTTGISAHDRALTARKLADSSSKPADFSRPGHLVPLRASENGVLSRRGHTEAAVDLCKLAGLPPLGLLCEIVKPDDPQGSMARRDDCLAFARQHGLKMITIEALEAHRRSHS